MAADAPRGIRPECRVDGADILVLSPTPTAPTDQGNRKRIDAVCRELQRRGARIHFVFYPHEWWFECMPQDHLDAMARAWDRFHLVAPSRPSHTPPAGDDYLIDDWWDDAIGHHLQWLFRRQKFDAFIVNYAFMSKALEFAPPGTLKILDTHDLFTGRRELLAAQGLPPEFFYTTAEQEAIALNRADLVWAIKDEEAAFYRGLADTRVITVPHVEPPSPVARRDTGDGQALVVGMLGSGNVINVSNARAFVQAALPVFRARGARIVLRFVGGMCARLGDLSGLDGVDLRGPVETVDEFYEAVDVVVVPLAFSTGLKIKAVEAFATGAPLVAIGHALEGIPVEHPWHRLDTMAQIAEACCDIAADRHRLDELRQATAEASRRLALLARAAFDETLQMLQARPTVIVVLGPAFFEPDGLLREHVAQTVNLLQQTMQVLLYTDGPLPRLQTVLFESFHGLAAAARLVLAPGADPLPGRSLGLASQEMSWADLLARHPHAPLWLTAVPAGLAAHSGALAHRPVFARLDAMRLAGRPPGPADCAAWARAEALTLIDSAPQPLLPEVPAAARAMCVPFYRWKPGRLGDPQAAGGDVLLLLRADQASLADVLLPHLSARHAGRLGWRAAVDGAAPLALADATRAVRAGRHLLAGFANLRPLPAALVDLTDGLSTYEPLREALSRARVPVITLSMLADGAPAPTAAALVARLETLPDDLPDWRERCTLRFQARHGSDAGWLQVRAALRAWAAASG